MKDYEIINGRPVIIERPQNIDDDLMDMLDSYGYLGDDLDDMMHENGVSWSDFF